MSDTEHKESLQDMCAWAKQQCERWNWDANAAEIAQELIELGVTPGSLRFEILKTTFNSFFDHPKMDVAEAIEKMLETFGEYEEEYDQG